MTAVEWLATYLKGITSLNCDEVIEQAKEMEKQQIKDAYKVDVDEYPTQLSERAEQYYNETYGSKGNANNIKSGLTIETNVEKVTEADYIKFLEKKISTLKSASSQTEISDEEIEQGAWENPCLSRQDVYELFDEIFKDKTVQGTFKISASKEVQQFKEQLRKLAKQRYREQLKTK